MIRAAQTKRQRLQAPPGPRALQGAHAFDAIDSPAADTGEAPETTDLDGSGFREGVREVFLTLSATIAIGFAWAAIEMARLGVEPAPTGASRVETGYDDAAWTGQ